MEKNEMESPVQSQFERAIGSAVAVASRQTVTITTTTLGLLALLLAVLGCGY